MDQVVAFTSIIDTYIINDLYQYQHLHMGNCTCVSCSVQKLYRASSDAPIVRRMRGVDHRWILDC